MFRVTILAFFLSVGLLLQACSDGPRLDATNEQTLAESTDAVMAELDEATAERFSVALAQIHSYGAVQLLMGEKNPEQIQQEIYLQLDNRTAEEVIAQAEAMQADFQEALARQMKRFMLQE